MVWQGLVYLKQPQTRRACLESDVKTTKRPFFNTFAAIHTLSLVGGWLLLTRQLMTAHFVRGC